MTLALIAASLCLAAYFYLLWGLRHRRTQGRYFSWKTARFSQVRRIKVRGKK